MFMPCVIPKTCKYDVIITAMIRLCYVAQLTLRKRDYQDEPDNLSSQTYFLLSQTLHSRLSLNVEFSYPLNSTFNELNGLEYLLLNHFTLLLSPE